MLRVRRALLSVALLNRAALLHVVNFSHREKSPTDANRSGGAFLFVEIRSQYRPRSATAKVRAGKAAREVRAAHALIYGASKGAPYKGSSRKGHRER